MDDKIPFEIGAMYFRRDEIHALVGGQRQGGISTPVQFPFVLIFTGEGGEAHGYKDFWESEDCFHYFGEGQEGDMKMQGGNKAILNHQADGKRLLLFQMTGKSKPCRYLGEFECSGWYERPNTPASVGPSRKAIVFKLNPKHSLESIPDVAPAAEIEEALGLDDTVSNAIVQVRKSQDLFRKRLFGLESGCRITGIRDARFLRASHIKPWSECDNGSERVDAANGLLLAPHIDVLFDRGWISFDDEGRLLVSEDLPADVIDGLGVNLTPGRKCGTFSERQRSFLAYHRSEVFGRRYK